MHKVSSTMAYLTQLPKEGSLIIIVIEVHHTNLSRFTEMSGIYLLLS